MFLSFSFLQIKHILTKKNFEMYLRAGKTDIFSVFYVENGKMQYVKNWKYISFSSSQVHFKVLFSQNVFNLQKGEINKHLFA